MTLAQAVDILEAKLDEAMQAQRDELTAKMIGFGATSEELEAVLLLNEQAIAQARPQLCNIARQLLAPDRVQ